MSQFAYMDDFGSSPISPRSFHNLIQPTWARVYIEVAAKKGDQNLEWESDEVLGEFIALTGFDPRRSQFSPVDVQMSALTASHELRRGLYEADEIAQLDGASALDFAAGWMVCRDLMTYSQLSAENIEVALQRCMSSAGNRDKDAFRRGFMVHFAKQSKA
jgi:hypothetical protein